MAIHIQVDLEPGETLAEVLGRAGLIPSAPRFNVTAADIEAMRGAGPSGTIIQIAPTPLPAAAGEAHHESGAPDGQQDAAGRATAEPPKRAPGRPRKDGSPAQPRPPVPAAEAKPAVFTVRRYGGQTEGEYTDSGQAADVLLGLIREAGDGQALDELMQHNAEEVLTWPKERQQDVIEAADAVRAVMKAGEPEAEAAKPATPARQHLDLDGQPFHEVTLDAKGVMTAANACVAMDDGVVHGPHWKDVSDKMAELGITRIGKVDTSKPEGVAALAALGRFCAAKLGLPVAEAGAGGLL